MGAPWLNPRPAPFLAFQMIDARYEQAIHSRGSCYLCDCSSHAPAAIGAWMGRHHCWHRNPNVGERSRFSDSWWFSGRALAREHVARHYLVYLSSGPAILGCPLIWRQWPVRNDVLTNVAIVVMCLVGLAPASV